MRKIVVGLALLGLAGCGPRPLTPQEKAAKKAEAAANARVANAKEQAEKARDAKAAERAAKAKLAAQESKARAVTDRKKAEHEARVATYRKHQLGKIPLPKGVTQLSSDTFIVDRRFASNGRYLCSGPVLNADNSKVGGQDSQNDVSEITGLDAKQLKYVCQQPVRKYRDAGFKP